MQVGASKLDESRAEISKADEPLPIQWIQIHGITYMQRGDLDRISSSPDQTDGLISLACAPSGYRFSFCGKYKATDYRDDGIDNLPARPSSLADQSIHVQLLFKT